jgi:hypothetical protein
MRMSLEDATEPTRADRGEGAVAGRRWGARLWKAQDVSDHRCPGCGEEFVAGWQVAIGEEAGYTPVFGGPVVLHFGLCGACHAEYERTGNEPWRRRGAG